MSVSHARRAVVTATLAAGVAAACERAPEPVPPADPARESTAPEDEDFPLAGEARAGVESEELAELLVAHADWQMRQSPTSATALGDHRFDDQLAVRDAAAIAARREARKDFLDRARGVDRGDLAHDDAITLDLFVGALEADVAREVCELHQWSVSSRSNPVTRLGVLPDLHDLEAPEDGQNLASRYAMIPDVMEAEIENLRRGLDEGLVANAASLSRTAELLTDVLDDPVEEWDLARPAREELSDWPEEEAEAFSAEILAILEDEVRPAAERYRDVVADELAPAGRGPEEAGLHGLPEGDACYEALIYYYTGREDVTANELHDVGRREIEEITGEMRALGEELFGTRDVEETLSRLRTDDELYFENEDEIVTVAEEAVDRARDAIPEVFGILPEAEVVVRPIPAHEAPYTTIAYYRRPHADGSKPGEYFVNTYEPETRPRYTAEVLAFHEAIPGHHLQIAIAQEREDLPLFRRHGGSTAFIEGWALYIERLADEMGLYSGDVDRMGMLGYDAWRASRLVVDTGLHAEGWTREEAEAYMMENTPLTEDNIRNEVDRYLTTPGQALAYKVGQLEILRLRERARAELGEDFSLVDFHDEVLRHGAVNLPVLRDRVEAWLERRAGE